MAVEIALLKAARPDLDPTTEGLLRRIEKLEAQLAGSAPPPTPIVPPPVPPARPTEPTPSTPHPSRPEPQASAPEPAATQPPEPQPQTPEPSPPAPTAPSAGGADGGSSPAAREDEDPPSATGPAAETPEPAPEAPPTPSSVDAQNLDQVKRIWPTVLDKLAEKAPALAATFDGAGPIAFEGDDLTIGFPADQPFNNRKAESPDRRQALVDAFTEVTGGPVAPLYVLLEEDAPAPTPAAPPDTPAPGSAGIDEDELLQRLKSEFDAEEVS
jgi:DNA polymerase-3 subunit gamma/tau